MDFHHSLPIRKMKKKKKNQTKPNQTKLTKNQNPLLVTFNWAAF
jgi:hypothetical protein